MRGARHKQPPRSGLWMKTASRMETEHAAGQFVAVVSLTRADQFTAARAKACTQGHNPSRRSIPSGTVWSRGTSPFD